MSCWHRFRLDFFHSAYYWVFFSLNVDSLIPTIGSKLVFVNFCRLSEMASICVVLYNNTFKVSQRCQPPALYGEYERNGRHCGLSHAQQLFQ